MSDTDQPQPRTDRFVGDADEMTIRKPSKYGTVYDAQNFKRIRTATKQDEEAMRERGQIQLADGRTGIIR
jgi:hypothetical protein